MRVGGLPTSLFFLFFRGEVAERFSITWHQRGERGLTLSVLWPRSRRSLLKDTALLSGGIILFNLSAASSQSANGPFAWMAERCPFLQAGTAPHWGQGWGGFLSPQLAGRGPARACSWACPVRNQLLSLGGHEQPQAMKPWKAEESSPPSGCSPYPPTTSYILVL